MKFSEEIMKRIQDAKNAEEVLAIAAESNVKITEEEAKKLFEQFNSAELDDDALEGIAGGVNSSPATGLVQLINPSSARL